MGRLDTMRLLPVIFMIGLALAGCGKGVSDASKEESFLIKGVIKGLDGSGLVITNAIDGNVKDTLTFDAPNILIGGDVQDVSFYFSSAVVNGNHFAVEIGKQPAERFQLCEVKNGSGRVLNSDITNIEIDCVTRKFPVGGSVQGLMKGSTLTISNSNSEAVTLSESGEFVFPNEMLSGDAYVVSVKVNAPVTFPVQKCSVSNNRGTVRDVAVSSLVVTCATSWHMLNTQVSGLRENSVLLRSDVAGDLLVEGSGTINAQFKAAVPKGADYTVSVKSNPTDPYQECNFPWGNDKASQATGSMGDLDITVNVTCEDKRFYVKGVVNGLTANGLRLRNNGGDLVEVNLPTATPSGRPVSFQFRNSLVSNENYSVVIDQQPGESQTCTISANNGTIVNHDIIVVVNCEANSYTLGGVVSGLSPLGTGLVLANGQNTVKTNSNGTFSFLAPVRGGAEYNVVVDTAPRNPSQTCAISGGKGAVGSSNVTDIAVNCTINRFSVGGTITGLAANDKITLQNNEGDDLIVGANGAFRFPTELLSGNAYRIAVLEQPASQWCGVNKASGNIGNGRVGDVEINCITSYTLGGTVKGLLPNRSVTLQDTRGGMITVRNPATSFLLSDSRYFTGNRYNVSVAAQPEGENCSVDGGNGVMGSANATAIAVACQPNSYILKVTVTGLSGSGLVLKNNNTSLALAPDNTYSANLASGTMYSFSLDSSATNPAQQCSFPDNNALGEIVSSDVAISVICTGVRYTVGGSVTGLIPGRGITLQDNKGGRAAVSNPGGANSVNYTLSTLYSSGDDYNISIAAPPDGQTCALSSNSNGTMADTNITNVVATCSPILYRINGTITGVHGSGLAVTNNNAGITLTDNVGDATIKTFTLDIDSGLNYNIRVSNLPTNPAQTCSFADTSASSSGTIYNSDLNVLIVCTDVTYSIGGSINGYSGSGMILNLNGSPTPFAISGSTFTLTTQLNYSADYAVTISAQPADQKCTVTNGAGKVNARNITSVQINCANLHLLGGVVSGLTSGSFEMRGATGELLQINSNGAFEFKTKVASGDAYGVSISTQPASQNCTVMSGGFGIVGVTDVGDIVIQCGLGWKWARPSPQGNALYGVAWNGQSGPGSLYVAVGAGGAILTSKDSVSWTSQNSGLRLNFSSITWRPSSSSSANDGYFLASAEPNAYGISSDGKNWMVRAFTEYGNSNVSSVVWAGDRFIAVFNGGYILSSLDGINWSKTSSGYYYLKQIVWTGSLLVAIPYSSRNGILKSGNMGQTWDVGAISNDVQGIAWKPPSVAGGLDGLLVAVGNNYIVTSPDRIGDGIVWTTRPAGSLNLSAVTWTGTSFVAMGPNGVVVADGNTNGQAWMPNSYGASNTATYMATLGGVSIAVGLGGMVTTSPDNDGVVWTPRANFASNSAGYWQSANWVNNQLMLAYSNNISAGIVSGGDATSLTALKTNLSFAPYSIAYSDTATTKRYVATWGYGTYSSTDGSNWTSASSYPFRGLGVIWANNQFVEVGSNSSNDFSYVYGSVRTSPDGLNWTEQDPKTPQSTDLTGICWVNSTANPHYVAVGSGGAVTTSPDGVSWTAQNSATDIGLHGVVCNGDFIVAVGVSDTILVSEDGGINWVSRNFNTKGGSYLNDIVWTGTRYIAVGSNGKVMTSVGSGDVPAGIRWVTEASGTNNELTNIVWTGTQAVVTGAFGAVLYIP